MLDKISSNKPINYAEFYKIAPFNKSVDNQYPGNVIQYLMMQFSSYCVNEVVFDRANEIFISILNEINSKTLSSFTAKDCATTLHRIALCVSKINNLSVSEEKINLLINQLHKKRNSDSYQAIANGMWAVAKLLDSGKHIHLDFTHIVELTNCFNAQRINATPQSIGNILWAIGKLLIHRKHIPIEESVISDLIGALHVQRTEAIHQNIVNGLWGIAQLIIANKKITVNKTWIQELYQELVRRDNPAYQDDRVLCLELMETINGTTPPVDSHQTYKNNKNVLFSKKQESGSQQKKNVDCNLAFAI
ncbi:MAG: hypothetical protein WC627_10440 [Legionella sp.]|jgi:hypothetical protein